MLDYLSPPEQSAVLYVVLWILSLVGTVFGMFWLVALWATEIRIRKCILPGLIILLSVMCGWYAIQLKQ